jgi:DNA mismatch repair protein MutS
LKEKNQLSPMMRRYLEIKEQYKDAILLFRLGDFYEMFFDDAVTASDFLNLTLTGRDCGLEERAPMCGVPYHAVDNYIKKLIDGGFKVAICEQLNTPEETQKGKQLDRDVVRVITAGTVVEDSLLPEKDNNYIASVYVSDKGFGLAWADMSTGEFCLFENDAQNPDVLDDVLASISPCQTIINSKGDGIVLNSVMSGRLKRPETYFDWAFSFDNAEKTLLKQLGVKTLEPFECADKKLAISAGGALVEYMLQTGKRDLSHINKINFVRNDSFMLIDVNTRRNLELTETMHEGKRFGSLLWLLDKTVTSMGARLIKNWIEKPLVSAKSISARLNAVEAIANDKENLSYLRESLRGIRDIERLSARIAYGNTNPRDLISIGETLKALPLVKSVAKCFDDKNITKIANTIVTNDKLSDKIFAAIDEKAGASIKDGQFIREGFDKRLDEYRNAKKEGTVWLANLEAAEKENTGIKNLKVGYNKIFGYYIEVSKSQVDMVPLRYQRKQTLVGGERYVTEELKEIENRILGSEENAVELELAIFEDLVQELKTHIDEFLQSAKAVQTIDVLQSFATVALSNNYVKPVVSDKIKHISIKNGRHPIVEAVAKSTAFVPNDTNLDEKENRCMIITGPNMAGKSTYMRQVALITLMAQIGSFVPADSAEISLTDRIFTRVGASDDITLGQSTFMVEMVEVATILNNATDKSLLILDEIGRGTSTIDGLSIAWAVIEEISRNIGAKTLFATHFHELSELEGVLDGVKNFQILIKEIGGTIVFLHKIVRGSASKSFGIEVAELAGIPKNVVTRAKTIMRQLEEIDINRDTNSIMMTAKGGKQKQISLFDERLDDNEIVKILKDTNIENVSPVQAFAILLDLKDKADKL